MVVSLTVIKTQERQVPTIPIEYCPRLNLKESAVFSPAARSAMIAAGLLTLLKDIRSLVTICRPSEQLYRVAHTGNLCSPEIRASETSL